MKDTAERDYPSFVESRFKKLPRQVETLLHAAVGISGEAGELLDIVKKGWIYDAAISVEHLEEELGDILFYAQALANALGLSLEEIQGSNRAKLERRYPTGYTDEAARERADKDPNKNEALALSLTETYPGVWRSPEGLFYFKDETSAYHGPFVTVYQTIDALGAYTEAM